MRVGLCGKMRAGKDSCAEYLQGKYGGVVLKFATPLYDMQKAVYEIAGLPERKDRSLLQFLGTNWGRSIDTNIWVNVMAKKIDSLPETTNIFLSDLRFSNEEQMLREKGLTIIKVQVDDKKLLERGASLVTHESERWIVDYTGADYTIKNDSTIVRLHEKLDVLANLF